MNGKLLLTSSSSTLGERERGGGGEREGEHTCVREEREEREKFMCVCESE